MKRAKKIVYDRVTKINGKHTSCTLSHLTSHQLGGETESAVLTFLKKRHPTDKEIVIKKIEWE